MSTLFVNNLNTASGSNITLASGKTLDASGGTIVPSTNQIIQVFEKEFSNATATTSGSFVDCNGASITFAPKYSNSLLIFHGHFQARYDHNTSAGGAYNWNWNGSNVNSQGNYQMYDDGSGNRYRMVGLYGSITAGTTSSATIKLQQAAYNGCTLWTNWNGTHTSGFMVMEVAQ